MQRDDQERTSKVNFNESSYPEYFRRDAHQLLAWGYQNARRGITTEMIETKITKEIARSINAVLESIDLPENIFNRNYAVKAEDPIEESSEDQDDTFLDILIEDTHGTPRMRYIFEAKRLKKNSTPIGLYFERGIMNFVSGRYAARYPEAAMIGCFQSDNAGYWLSEIERKLKADEEGVFRFDGELVFANVVPELAHSWRSVHQRKESRIILFHILLDFT